MRSSQGMRRRGAARASANLARISLTSSGWTRSAIDATPVRSRHVSSNISSAAGLRYRSAAVDLEHCEQRAACARRARCGAPSVCMASSAMTLAVMSRHHTSTSSEPATSWKTSATSRYAPFGAAHPGVRPRRWARRRSRTVAEILEHDDEVGGVDEIEQRLPSSASGSGRRCRRGRGLRRSGRGRRRSRTATGRAWTTDAGVRGSRRLRHVVPPVVGVAALHAARNRDTTWRVRRSTRGEYSSAPGPEVQPMNLGESDPGWRAAPLVDCPVPQRSYDHWEW